MQMVHAAVVAGLALGLVSGAANAAPITYEFTGVASGTYGQRSFVDTVFKINLTSDTNSVFSPVPGVAANNGPTTVSVTGVVNNKSVDLSTVAFANYPNSSVGLDYYDQAGNPHDAFYGVVAPLAGYDFASNFPLTPETGIFNGLENGLLVDGKVLTVSNIASLNFSATVSAVPLPASAPMFGAALLALGAVGYGVKRKKAAASA